MISSSFCLQQSCVTEQSLWIEFLSHLWSFEWRNVINTFQVVTRTSWNCIQSLLDLKLPCLDLIEQNTFDFFCILAFSWSIADRFNCAESSCHKLGGNYGLNVIVSPSVKTLALLSWIISYNNHWIKWYIVVIFINLSWHN